MKSERIEINKIPAIVWGEKSEKIYIFVHGKKSYKEEAEFFAKIATAKNYQVLSFDLPEHGERKNENYPCDIWNGVSDLNTIWNYVEQRWSNISLFANSLGAYFSLMTYNDYPLSNCLFLSPILDMERLINNMMTWFNVSEEVLKEKKQVPTTIGEVLDWNYYSFVKDNRIKKWNIPTAILYGTEDNMTEREVVDNFVKNFNADLTVLQGSEHYFYTQQQMDFFKLWADKHI